jgi:hypothetical protein
MASPRRRAINLGQQLHAIKVALPAAAGEVRNGKLNCILPIRPSPASRHYTVRLTYRHGAAPHVTVEDPPLDLHPGATALPHVYAGDELCLYYPGQWDHAMLLAHTIVPWTSEWLMYYELWLVTGRWSGGGATHTVD